MHEHLSIRVPWHDNGWDGTVCRNPERNQSCRVLKAIAEDKNDALEIEIACQKFCVKNNYLPPCLLEGAMFMSENAVATLPIRHPYTYATAFKHIAETPYSIAPFSLISKPFFWTLREEAINIAENKLYSTGYDDSIEIDVGSGSWVSNGINQKHIFDYFYRNVMPGKSMAVVYSKAVPFIETPGRVIIGVGVITSIENIREYKYDPPQLEPGDISSYLWERQLGHSIRHNRENGFLFPFDEIQKYLKGHPEQSPEELVVIAPDGYFEEFSYATEHLSYDALILTLNQTIKVLQKYKQIGLSYGDGKNWDSCINWCQEKLKAVWSDRGLYPGLGNMLQAAGLPYGSDIATAIRAKIGDNELWEKLPEALANLKDYIPANLGNIKLTKTELLVWKKENYDKKLPFLKLLSRINLTLEQANVALFPTQILANGKGKPHYADFLSDFKKIKITDIISNPYVLYEKTRLFEEKYRFGVGQIDVAMFPSPAIGGETIVGEADDIRRIRAIGVSVLENAAQSGNTLMIADDIVTRMNAFRSDVDLEFNISHLALSAFEDILRPEFCKTVAVNENLEQISAFQLGRFVQFDDCIRSFVQSRIEDNIEIEGEWEQYLIKVLNREANTEHEQESRLEKLKAIEIMAKSKISVLTGGAGTGKTTTLAALCLSPDIQENGIVILAPTGKARVVLDTKLRENGIDSQEAYTIFQFLQKTYHCDWKTYKYYLSGEKSATVAGATVIVDECSMLTEEMLGALAETLQVAKRVILVGDPNQVPPIGAGKPFFELAEYLSEKSPNRYAKLTVSNRQKSKKKERLDVELAKLFTYDQSKQVGDDLFLRISKDTENIEFVPFANESYIQETLLKTLAKAIGMRDIEDIKGFDESLGGEVNGEWMNFTDVKMVDNWQILSPYRNDAVIGSTTINRYVHEKYRINPVVKGFPKKRSTNHPLGNDGIIYGEKVINIRNQPKDGYPTEGCSNYVANGEVGIVERIWQKPKDRRNSHQVRFTSQTEFNYNWDSKITDNDSDLELAYALTVHKAQGSGFGITIFIINESPKGPSAFISREMIYTALSRQKDKIFVLYNKPAQEIKKYSDSLCSDLARRLTNLFESPTIRRLDERYYADKLIHITSSGKKVRSKSEVIIANELDNAGIPFEYEKKLVLNDGKEFIPDFTLYEDNLGQIYWEHLGMLSDADYRKKWEHKQSEYLKNGISEENKNLIVTEDNANGGIDSSIIAQRVKSIQKKRQ